MPGDLVIYGAYGYTGTLVAELAVERGLEPVLGGRDRGRLESVATRLGCHHLVASLDDEKDLDFLLEQGDAVLHCAGPFVDTVDPMLEACLRTGTHYLDITGEIPVFATVAGSHEQAADAGVACCPGVGFDVVPTDCLAAHLVERLPEATDLSLAFDAGGGLSPGTAHSLVEHVHEGNAVRRGGDIERVPLAHESRTVDFGWDRGDRSVVTIPWGDVFTAYHTTHVPSIAVSTAMHPSTVRWYRLAGRLSPLLARPTVKRALHWLVDRRVDGPDADERASTSSYVHGVATAPDGERAIARLRCPNTYTTTADTAVAIAERVLEDPPDGGFHTPAGAYGSDLILEATDAEREDVA